MQKERRYKDEEMNVVTRDLDTYRVRQRQIMHLTQKLEEYRTEYSGIEAMCFDGLCVQGGERKDKLVEIAIKWADLESEVHRLKAEAELDILPIELKLNTLSCLQRQVLHCYYIEGKTIEQIAKEMNYSEEWVKTTKYNALKRYANN